MVDTLYSQLLRDYELLRVSRFNSKSIEEIAFPRWAMFLLIPLPFFKQGILDLKCDITCVATIKTPPKSAPAQTR